MYTFVCIFSVVFPEVFVWAIAVIIVAWLLLDMFVGQYSLLRGGKAQHLFQRNDDWSLLATQKSDEGLKMDPAKLIINSCNLSSKISLSGLNS